MNDKLALTLSVGLSVDLRAFLPEIVLSLGIVLFLLFRLFPRYDQLHMGRVAVFLGALVLFTSFLQWFRLAPVDPAGNESLPGWLAQILHEIVEIGRAIDPRNDSTLHSSRSYVLFGGMLIYDDFTVFLKLFLYSFLSLVVILTLLTGIPDKEDSADFYVLLFGSTLGMSLMASSNHLLMVFLSIEMASLPSYALAGFLKGRRQSSEAALKYVVYGGGASGVMLYGISLIAGKFDTGYLPTIVAQITAIDPISLQSNLSDPVIAVGLTFILAGIGFKLASVPFHFWCPDVFEGAAAEVGAFLSVASKGAALALLARIVLGLGGLTGSADQLTAWTRATDYLVPVLSIFAVATTTFGNLAAYGQTNLKRLLAYSTIAHAGFMMMGLAAMTKEGAAAVLFYLITYLFMNLGAFAVVAMLRNLTGQEDLAYFRGFVYRSPLLVIMLGVFLLSLLGMPPLAGFTAKFQIFTVLYDAADKVYADRPFLKWTMYSVLLAAGMNTVISLFYYVKVLKVMILEKTLEEVEDRPIEAKPAPILQAIYVSVLALVVVGLGVFWNPLAEASSIQGVASFRSTPTFDAEPPAAKEGALPGPPKGGGPKGGAPKKLKTPDVE
ncbi:MAG: NADH-quinone oxidoreductase subunit N [Gemmataceae bacterium]|nr:NADH-quinone oxidoreductase subunit N [Gemmataceae bacterium]